MSKRLLKEEVARGTLKMLKLPGWPLHRTIHIVRLREAYPFRAMRQLLELAATRVPDIDMLKPENAES